MTWKVFRRSRGTILGMAVALSLTTGVQAATAAPAPDGPRGPAGNAVNTAFADAAAEFDVPRDLLVAVGYGETHLDGHDGAPSHANGYGVMHLVSNPERHSLERAAKLTGESVGDLKDETPANIRGGAAVLRDLADDLGLDAAERDDTDAWYRAVARYGTADSDQAARLYADAVYGILSDGLRTFVAGGERVQVAPQDVAPERGRYAEVSRLPGIQSADYPPAHWVAASSSNYSSGRSSAITHIVVHVTQGSYGGTISWFQNPSAQVSAHYVIRSSDGDVTQMVRDGDTAWHARSGNPYSVGIEHEGYVDDPSWFTDAMYRSSAALTKHLADRYGIPKDRAHIVGHHEVPGNDHTDPGPHWDWNYYMSLVGGGGGGTGTPFPTWGSGVNIREAATTDSAVVGTLGGPTTVRVECQVRGQMVNYDGYSNDAWSYVPAYGGYLSNIFIDVSDAWLPGVPTC
ncbi:N-acetylmuramoyl-L-alanine amidase [Streptomyces sp. DSM 42041]|uniref:N-acetylmuramoyl-L-alanine amidase n=1 Tax=Streptomyces hazeniae TaxID=3075538 RepID=A0ABU2NMJ3_9ACTN|nr:N-acetylmuramoyl-L-alanine amidase [Streptomyces sp. DSM 42041]MDT0377811.1 N-acetylmuramoyl-L-alanine amidase [Streptomyces sp. DSM 42041]